MDYLEDIDEPDLPFLDWIIVSPNNKIFVGILSTFLTYVVLNTLVDLFWLMDVEQMIKSVQVAVSTTPDLLWPILEFFGIKLSSSRQHVPAVQSLQEHHWMSSETMLAPVENILAGQKSDQTNTHWGSLLEYKDQTTAKTIHRPPAGISKASRKNGTELPVHAQPHRVYNQQPQESITNLMRNKRKILQPIKSNSVFGVKSDSKEYMRKDSFFALDVCLPNIKTDKTEVDDQITSTSQIIKHLNGDEQLRIDVVREDARKLQRTRHSSGDQELLSIVPEERHHDLLFHSKNHVYFSPNRLSQECERATQTTQSCQIGDIHDKRSLTALNVPLLQEASGNDVVAESQNFPNSLSQLKVSCTIDDESSKTSSETYIITNSKKSANLLYEHQELPTQINFFPKLEYQTQEDIFRKDYTRKKSTKSRRHYQRKLLWESTVQEPNGSYRKENRDKRLILYRDGKKDITSFGDIFIEKHNRASNRAHVERKVSKTVRVVDRRSDSRGKIKCSSHVRRSVTSFKSPVSSSTSWGLTDKYKVLRTAPTVPWIIPGSKKFETRTLSVKPPALRYRKVIPLVLTSSHDGNSEFRHKKQVSTSSTILSTPRLKYARKPTVKRQKQGKPFFSRKLSPASLNNSSANYLYYTETTESSRKTKAKPSSNSSVWSSQTITTDSYILKSPPSVNETAHSCNIEEYGDSESALLPYSPGERTGGLCQRNFQKQQHEDEFARKHRITYRQWSAARQSNQNVPTFALHDLADCTPSRKVIPSSRLQQSHTDCDSAGVTTSTCPINKIDGKVGSRISLLACSDELKCLIRTTITDMQKYSSTNSFRVKSKLNPHAKMSLVTSDITMSDLSLSKTSNENPSSCKCSQRKHSLFNYSYKSPSLSNYYDKTQFYHRRMGCSDEKALSIDDTECGREVVQSYLYQGYLCDHSSFNNNGMLDTKIYMGNISDTSKNNKADQLSKRQMGSSRQSRGGKRRIDVLQVNTPKHSNILTKKHSSQPECHSGVQNQKRTREYEHILTDSRPVISGNSSMKDGQVRNLISRVDNRFSCNQTLLNQHARNYKHKQQLLVKPQQKLSRGRRQEDQTNNLVTPICRDDVRKSQSSVSPGANKGAKTAAKAKPRMAYIKSTGNQQKQRPDAQASHTEHRQHGRLNSDSDINDCILDHTIPAGGNVKLLAETQNQPSKFTVQSNTKPVLSTPPSSVDVKWKNQVNDFNISHQDKTGSDRDSCPSDTHASTIRRRHLRKVFRKHEHKKNRFNEMTKLNKKPELFNKKIDEWSEFLGDNYDRKRSEKRNHSPRKSSRFIKDEENSRLRSHDINLLVRARDGNQHPYLREKQTPNNIARSSSSNNGLNCPSTIKSTTAKDDATSRLSCETMYGRKRVILKGKRHQLKNISDNSMATKSSSAASKYLTRTLNSSTSTCHSDSSTRHSMPIFTEDSTDNGTFENNLTDQSSAAGPFFQNEIADSCPSSVSNLSGNINGSPHNKEKNEIEEPTIFVSADNYRSSDSDSWATNPPTSHAVSSFDSLSEKQMHRSNDLTCFKEIISPFKHKSHVRFQDTAEETDSGSVVSRDNTSIKAPHFHDNLPPRYSKCNLPYKRVEDRPQPTDWIESCTSEETFISHGSAIKNDRQKTITTNISNKCRHTGRNFQDGNTDYTSRRLGTSASTKKLYCVPKRQPSKWNFSPPSVLLDGEHTSYMEIVPKRGKFKGLRLSQMGGSDLSQILTKSRHPTLKRHRYQTYGNQRFYNEANIPSLPHGYNLQSVSSASTSHESLHTAHKYPLNLTLQSRTPWSTSSTEETLLTPTFSTQWEAPIKTIAMIQPVHISKPLEKCPRNKRFCPTNKDSKASDHGTCVLHHLLDNVIKASSRYASRSHLKLNNSEAQPMGGYLRSMDPEVIDYAPMKDVQFCACCHVNKEVNKPVRTWSDKQVSCNIHEEMAEKEAQTSTLDDKESEQLNHMKTYINRQLSIILQHCLQRQKLQDCLDASTNTDLMGEMITRAMQEALASKFERAVDKQLAAKMSTKQITDDSNVKKLKKKNNDQRTYQDFVEKSDSSLLLKMELNSKPKYSSSIKLEKRYTNRDSSCFHLQDLIKALKLIGSYSGADTNADVCTTISPGRFIKSPEPLQSNSQSADIRNDCLLFTPEDPEHGPLHTVFKNEELDTRLSFRDCPASIQKIPELACNSSKPTLTSDQRRWHTPVSASTLTSPPVQRASKTEQDKFYFPKEPDTKPVVCDRISHFCQTKDNYKGLPSHCHLPWTTLHGAKKRKAKRLPTVVQRCGDTNPGSIIRSVPTVDIIAVTGSDKHQPVVSSRGNKYLSEDILPATINPTNNQLLRSQLLATNILTNKYPSYSTILPISPFQHHLKFANPNKICGLNNDVESDSIYTARARSKIPVPINQTKREPLVSKIDRPVLRKRSRVSFMPNEESKSMLPLCFKDCIDQSFIKKRVKMARVRRKAQ